MCLITILSSHALLEKQCRFCQKIAVLGEKLHHQMIKNCLNLEIFCPKIVFAYICPKNSSALSL
jgi:hypothetical protein